MAPPEFTVRLLAPNPHRPGTQIWKAGCIVTGMEGCRIESIVQALSAFEAETRAVGIVDPARWLTHFAGLESTESRKRIAAWIEIVLNGEVVASTRAFRDALIKHVGTAA